MQSEELNRAVVQWTAVLGAANVLIDEPSLQRAETATFAIDRRVPAILRPGSRAEVQDCVRIANQFRIPIHPISSGKNWGYGSRVPSADGCVLLDLGRLNRILDFHEELAYVTVEPGVTQRQLYSFLQERRSKLWMDASGASPDASLIGNTVERGFGHTPYGDHFSFCCGLEVVLPTGEMIETGSARFPNSQTAAVNRWGVGPSLDGLFSQSNLGIVTRMSILLMPQPEVFAAFFYRCNDRSALPALIDALRPLKLQEVLRSSMHIANDYKVLGGLRQYPWAEMNARTPLTPTDLEAFRKDLNFGYWNVSGGLYGTRAQVAEAKRLLKKALAGLPGKPNFVTPKLIGFAKRYARPYKMVTGLDIARTASLVEPVLNLMRGVPTDHALGSCYWRKRGSVPADPDPDRDRCGLLWYSPVAPSDGEKVQELSDIAIRTMLEFGFEPMISLTMLTARIVQCVTSLTYDRDVAGEDEKAYACYKALSERCTGAGFYPYRLGTQSSSPTAMPTSTAQTLAAIKRAVDPNGILSPGHYQE